MMSELNHTTSPAPTSEEGNKNLRLVSDRTNPMIQGTASLPADKHILCEATENGLVETSTTIGYSLECSAIQLKEHCQKQGEKLPKENIKEWFPNASLTSGDTVSAQGGVEAMTLFKNAEEKPRSNLLCRLCGIPCEESSPLLIFRNAPHHPEVLEKQRASECTARDEDVLALIKEVLPIKVSCCDLLPKQVCVTCLERLRVSHSFIMSVLEAESYLKNLSSLPRLNTEDSLFTDPVTDLLGKSSYECPICQEPAPSLLKRTGPSAKKFYGEGDVWDPVTIKTEPEEILEPSNEELERSYHEFFGEHEPTKKPWSDGRVKLFPVKHIGATVKRPRGRPRTRPNVTPRGRRGRRITQTTVERILQMGECSLDDGSSNICIRSGEENSASQALTQCLLCERWFPGPAACLQHSLAEHTDCGAFLCPRCPRDDFPGDFELIQHYQEAHCPDLELYEMCDNENNDKSEQSVDPWINGTEEKFEMLSNFESEHEGKNDRTSRESACTLKEGNSQPNETRWPFEAMELENSNVQTPSQEPFERHEVASNTSDLAPRPATSEPALFEKECNSLSIQESDSNLHLGFHSLSQISQQENSSHDLADDSLKLSEEKLASDVINLPDENGITLQEKKLHELDRKSCVETDIYSEGNGKCFSGDCEDLHAMDDKPAMLITQ